MGGPREKEGKEMGGGGGVGKVDGECENPWSSKCGGGIRARKKRGREGGAGWERWICEWKKE